MTMTDPMSRIVIAIEKIADAQQRMAAVAEADIESAINNAVAEIEDDIRKDAVAEHEKSASARRDGIMPEDEDDLTCDEVGEWVGSEDGKLEDVTHWLPFTPHPSAPPPTASFDDDDAEHGIRHLSRAERGITQQEIDATRAWYAEAGRIEARERPEQ